MGFLDKLKNAYNIFEEEQKNNLYGKELAGVPSNYTRPDYYRLNTINGRSMINTLYNRIALDVAAIEFYHAKVDENEQFQSEIHDSINNILTLEANIDQTARAFIQDAVLSMLDEGVIALVPVDTKENLRSSNLVDILTMRVGKITSWYPYHVEVELYRESTMQRERVTLPKSRVAIIQSPLYSILNDPNSTLKRLLRKLDTLDYIDEQTKSGKLNMIIQLPYNTKTENRKKQAEERRKDLDDQLKNSKYGVAYMDINEKITPVGRPLENNILDQIKLLLELLYQQTGMSSNIANGTANEQEYLEYFNRTVEPIVAAFTDEFNRKFLTATARTQGQRFVSFRNPFKFVPMMTMAQIADTLTRNEILTSNEIRGILGYEPSSDPNADVLLNKNIDHGYGFTNPAAMSMGQNSYQQQGEEGEEYPQEYQQQGEYPQEYQQQDNGEEYPQEYQQQIKRQKK